MTMSHRARVQTLVGDPATSLVQALHALIVLADEYSHPATAAWARQEIDGYPAVGPVPDYRKITAPIIGAGMPNGREIRQQVLLAGLPDSHREEIARLADGLALRQGIATLERSQSRPLYAASPDPVLRPGLPDLPELIRLMPERADGLTFVTLYWDIGFGRVAEVLAKIRGMAEEKVRGLAAPYPHPDDIDHIEGISKKMTLDKREIARMMRDIQKEFDKHPIRVPIETDPGDALDAGPVPTSTTIYNGPVFHGDANGSQLAWNNSGEINQQQTKGDQVVPGFEPLAQAVALVMQGLAKVELADDDRHDAEEAAAEIVTEVTTEQPNTGKIRRAVKVLKGALAPIAAGLTAATSAEVQEWARTAIDQLGTAL
ncbi:AbiTii domain-containing protein [Micromonospora haikouensis]|uniref:AbiTii domain-containing protein n=1 Tax=Micromonospora haikouensis TaxID=686309 RepID=UPI0037B78AF8